MSRYTLQFNSGYTDQQISAVVDGFYAAEGFQPAEYKNEQWYKKGIHVYQQTVTIEAFTRYALFPGVYVGELDLDGFVGAIPNKALKNRIETLVSQLAPTTQPVRLDKPLVIAQPQQPQLQNQYPQQPQGQYPTQPQVQSPAQPQAQYPEQPATGVRYCPQCGRENMAGATFCAGCGNKLQ